MRAENIVTKPFSRNNYVRTVMVLLGVAAFSASTLIAWPALTHIGMKLV